MPIATSFGCGCQEQYLGNRLFMLQVLAQDSVEISTTKIYQPNIA